MKPESYFLPYAESAFNAYRDEVNRWARGQTMPRWNEVGEAVQARWIAAVKEVFGLLAVRDKNDELYVS